MLEDECLIDKKYLADSILQKYINNSAKISVEFLKFSKSKLGIKMPFFPVHQNKFVTPLGIPKALGWNQKELTSSKQNPKVAPSSPILQ